MARRAGKAASRKARQRRVQRQGLAPSPAAASPPSDATVAAEPRPAPSTARRTPPLARQAIGSALTATERSEYHYVERDLRDIAILSVAMAALLFVAWLAVRGLGIIG